MLINRRPNIKGMSLIELIAAMTILSFASVSIYVGFMMAAQNMRLPQNTLLAINIMEFFQSQALHFDSKQCLVAKGEPMVELLCNPDKAEIFLYVQDNAELAWLGNKTLRVSKGENPEHPQLWHLDYEVLDGKKSLFRSQQWL